MASSDILSNHAHESKIQFPSDMLLLYQISFDIAPVRLGRYISCGTFVAVWPCESIFSLWYEFPVFWGRVVCCSPLSSGVAGYRVRTRFQTVNAASAASSRTWTSQFSSSSIIWPQMLSFLCHCWLCSSSIRVSLKFWHPSHILLQFSNSVKRFSALIAFPVIPTNGRIAYSIQVTINNLVKILHEDVLVHLSREEGFVNGGYARDGSAASLLNIPPSDI